MRQRNLAVSTRMSTGVSSGRVESQYFVGSFSPSGHSMRSPSSGCGVETFRSREAGRIRTSAKRDFVGALPPWTMRQAFSGSSGCHFEGRSWRGLHHHAALCIAAYGFLIHERAAIPLRPPAARNLSPILASHTRGAANPTRTAYRKFDRDDPKTTHGRPGPNPHAPPCCQTLPPRPPLRGSR
jgi:hypothetical protein